MNGNIIVVIHNDTLLNAGTADMLVTFQTLCAGIGTHEGVRVLAHMKAAFPGKDRGMNGIHRP